MAQVSDLASQAQLGELLRFASLHVQAGNLPAAQALLTRALAVQPSHPGALMGAVEVAFARGDYAEALVLTARGARAQPRRGDWPALAGRAHKEMGALGQAVTAYRKALRLEPQRADWQVSLGIALRLAGDADAAVSAYERALELDPSLVAAHHNLANVWLSQGRFEAARAAYERLLVIVPRLGEAHFELGNLARRRGLRAEALEHYRAALAAGLSSAANDMRLGNAFSALDEAAAASECYERAVRRAPRHLAARFALGGALYDLGRFDQAIACFAQALAIEPDSPEALVNLGSVLRGRGRRQEAIACFKRALERAPDLAEAHLNLGVALADLQHLERARVCVERALELMPASDEALAALAMVARKNLEFGHAIELCGRALERGANLPQLHMDLGAALVETGHGLQGIQSYREAAKSAPVRRDALASIAMASQYVHLDAALVYDTHLDFARETLHAAELAGSPLCRLAPPRRRARGVGPLRVGIVSPDLRRHAVASFVEPLLTHLDPERVAVVAYFNHPGGDEVTARLRALTSEWRDCVRWSDEELASRIREDEIDILLDLAGHTSWNRLSLFAHRIAPVQASWLGYPGTTGLSNMDLRITDGRVDPEDDPVPASERVLRLPHSYFCFHPPAEASAPRRSARQAPVVFGSYNNAAKVGDPTLDAWAAVLHAVPGSTLLLKHKAFGDAQVVARVTQGLQARAVAPERVACLPWVDAQGDHLAAYADVDIALDTFPYNGATTTCEALWMGVPVVSLSGATHASRMGRSILHAAGRDHWCACDIPGFVAIAEKLAAAGEFDEAARARLRADIAVSPLTDAAAFARAFETCLHEAWSRV